MEMKIKSQVQFNDDLSQRSNIVSGDSLSNSFAKIHHDLNDYEIAANIAANDRPKNLLYIHDILSDSVSTATEEILGYPIEAGTYVYSAEIYTVQNPSVANVTKIEFLGADGNTVVGTCNIACDTKKEEHINVTLSDEAYYIKYYRDTYSSETVGYLKTSKQMICLPNVYAAFPEYTMYAPSLGETFLEVEDSVKTYDVQDTYNSSSYKAISGKGVAAALETLDVLSVGGSGKYISAIKETDGKIEATAETMDTTPTENSTVPVTSGGVAASQALQETEIGIVANAGAKNYCPYNSLTADSAKTIIDKQPINLPAGTYVLSCSVTASTNSIAVRLLKDDTSLWNKTISNTGGLITEELTITDNANQITLYTGVANTISNIMIRSAAISDASYQPYAKTNRELTVAEDEDRAALIQQVDAGAKNLSPVASGGNGAQNFFQSDVFDFPAGNYILYLGNITTDATGNVNQVAFYGADSQNVGESQYYYISRGNGVYIPFVVTAECKYVRIYAGSNNSGSAGKTMTFTNMMICTAADWAVSQKFVPYAPTNRELYEMIQALQNGGIVNLVYGMGEEIPNNSDLDDYKTPGTFYVLNNTNASTIANKPIGGSGFRLIVSFTSATNRQRQEFYKPNTPDVIYIRNIGTDGNWSGWYQFNGTAVT
ncbi:MAG: hypothetical protein J6V44_15130 [Methanobrevibacter sp.]|nr:hypothetical protein [Methanobrevibacter sp.]MBO7696563.1 hypothetical protein [Methanobrevibacter sp.]